MTRFEVHHLSPYEEALGILKELDVKDGVLFAKIGKVSLALPLEFEELIRPHIGKRVGLIRTDIQGKQYLIRVISDQGLNDQSGGVGHEPKTGRTSGYSS